MAPCANWKGFLRLSLVTRPVTLYPAASEREMIAFEPIGPRGTASSISMSMPTPATRSPMTTSKGYMLDKDNYIEVTKKVLEQRAGIHPYN
jgi:DNA end-binding protein Ku